MKKSCFQRTIPAKYSKDSTWRVRAGPDGDNSDADLVLPPVSIIYGVSSGIAGYRSSEKCFGCSSKREMATRRSSARRRYSSCMVRRARSWSVAWGGSESISLSMASMSAATDASFSFKRSAAASGMAKHATTQWLGCGVSGMGQLKSGEIEAGCKGITDGDAVVIAAVLNIFGEDDPASGAAGGGEEQCVEELDAMLLMNLHRGE